MDDQKTSPPKLTRKDIEQHREALRGYNYNYEKGYFYFDTSEIKEMKLRFEKTFG